MCRLFAPAGGLTPSARAHPFTRAMDGITPHTRPPLMNLAGFEPAVIHDGSGDLVTVHYGSPAVTGPGFDPAAVARGAFDLSSFREG